MAKRFRQLDSDLLVPDWFPADDAHERRALDSRRFMGRRKCCCYSCTEFKDTFHREELGEHWSVDFGAAEIVDNQLVLSGEDAKVTAVFDWLDEAGEVSTEFHPHVITATFVVAFGSVSRLHWASGYIECAWGESFRPIVYCLVDDGEGSYEYRLFAACSHQDVNDGDQYEITLCVNSTSVAYDSILIAVDNSDITCGIENATGTTTVTAVKCEKNGEEIEKCPTCSTSCTYFNADFLGTDDVDLLSIISGEISISDGNLSVTGTDSIAVLSPPYPDADQEFHPFVLRITMHKNAGARSRVIFGYDDTVDPPTYNYFELYWNNDNSYLYLKNSVGVSYGSSNQLYLTHVDTFTFTACIWNHFVNTYGEYVSSSKEMETTTTKVGFGVSNGTAVFSDLYMQHPTTGVVEGCFYCGACASVGSYPLPAVIRADIQNVATEDMRPGSCPNRTFYLLRTSNPCIYEANLGLQYASFNAYTRQFMLRDYSGINDTCNLWTLRSAVSAYFSDLSIARLRMYPATSSTMNAYGEITCTGATEYVASVSPGDDASVVLTSEDDPYLWQSQCDMWGRDTAICVENSIVYESPSGNYVLTKCNASRYMLLYSYPSLTGCSPGSYAPIPYPAGWSVWVAIATDGIVAWKYQPIGESVGLSGKIAIDTDQGPYSIDMRGNSTGKYYETATIHFAEPT